MAMTIIQRYEPLPPQELNKRLRTIYALILTSERKQVQSHLGKHLPVKSQKGKEKQ